MRYEANPVIARSGWYTLAWLTFIALVLWRTAGFIYAAPLALIALMVAFKFRDPDRPVPASRLGVVAPVDGRVLSIRRVEDGPFGGAALKVRLRVSPFTVYGVRSPIEATVSDPATFCAASGTLRGFCLRTDEGDQMLIRMEHPGFGAPKAKVNIGQRLGHGERCGSVRFAHTVEMFLPPTAIPRVAPHDPAEAGVTVLAEFAPR
jgi:phosphatidylserine decarboxylase